MINSVSFFIMAPLNIRQTVYPKTLEDSPERAAFMFCIIRPQWAFTHLLNHVGFTVMSLMMPNSLPTCVTGRGPALRETNVVCAQTGILMAQSNAAPAIRRKCDAPLGRIRPPNIDVASQR